MDISDETITEIEEKLREIAELDPADLPEPAAELAEMLSALLEEVDGD
ncbi:MAG TPA: hypothetical protein VMO52_08430 [Acidimicrobiia bacterium]|jgi:hypothetical protein|nr:hypothetical protein [Acidimicrobiia bacterium]